MAYENAKTFLYRVLPWAPLGDPNAYVNVHWSYQGPEYQTSRFAGRACQTLAECEAVITSAGKRPWTKGIYLCVSTQREMKIEQYKNGGGSYRSAKREQSGAVHLRSLFIDIDVRPGQPDKGYETHADALAALMKFIKDAGLPRFTLLVNSGGGLQPYWTLGSALTKEEWQPLAGALANAIRRFGLKCDVGCTVDSARLMRMPDTINIKDGRDPVRAELIDKVTLPYDYTVEQISQALAPYMGAQVIQLTPRGKPAAEPSELGAGIEVPKAAPVSLESVAKAGCGFIHDALAHAGKDFAQPLWNLSTLIATFSEGQRDDAHRMASGHPDYDPGTTDELYDRKVREREEKDIGWPSCEAVANAGCNACKGCPLRGPHTKPLQFGRTAPKPAPAAVTTPGRELPPGYEWTENDHVLVRLTNAQGKERQIEVVPYALLEPWLQSDPWTLHFRTRTDHSRKLRSIKLPMEQAMSNDFGKVLGAQGMAFNNEQTKQFRTFVVAWIKLLQGIKDAVISSSPFGWSVAGGEVEGFVYNGQLFTPSGEKQAATPDPVLSSQYNPQGKLQPWLDAVDVINSLGSPERDFILASAFAGPLVAFTGQQGLVCGVYSSGSGFGKTSTLKISQAVWASPALAMQGLTDTTNNVANKAGQLRHLPLFWDELKTDDATRNFVDLMFQMVEGKERGRLNSNATLKPSQIWQTMLMYASNDSILDAVVRKARTTTAGLYRLFEFEVPEARIPSKVSPAELDRMKSKLNHNYGQAGLIYAKFLGENHVQAEIDVMGMRKAFANRYKMGEAERNWECTMAAIFVGATYANKLGLTKFDLKALVEFMVRILLKMRSEVVTQPVDMSQATSISNIIQQYYSHIRYRHVLITDIMHTGMGRPPKGMIIIPGSGLDISKVESPYIHIATKSQTMRFSLSAFRRWCENNNYSAHALQKQLMERFGAVLSSAKIAAGTGIAGLAVELVLDFDLTHPELAKIITYD